MICSFQQMFSGWRRPGRGLIVAMMTTVTLLVGGCSDDSAPPKDKAESEAPAGPQIAAITPAAARASGIVVAVAGPATISETITLYGTVRANAEREQNLRARYPGVVRAVNVRVGDAVKRGARLLTVESSESLQSYSIISPIAGTVLERHANVGETVDNNMVLIRVADLSTLWVEFAVFARDLGHVRAGLPVLISVSDGDFRTNATLTYVAPAGDSGNQTVTARAEVDNADRRWVSGQFVVGELTIDQFRAAVSVVPGAIQAITGRDIVFVETPDGFEARPVKLGRRSHSAVEVVSGLAAAERYAAVNSYLVKADLLKGEAEEE